MIFIVDMGSEVGGGHYSRCLNIARRLHNFEVVFLIREHGYVDPRFYDLANHYFFPSHICADNQIDFIRIKYDRVFCCVCDFTNHVSLSDKSNIKLFLNGLKECSAKVVLIDGRAEGRLIDNNENYACDLLITPYVDSEQIQGVGIHLRGEKFFVLPEYKNFDSSRSRVYDRRDKLNLLITFGQSDPSNLTELVLKMLVDNKISPELFSLKIVLGNLVCEERIRSIELLTVMLRMSHELVIAPTSLEDCFEWADLAISASGLTKYEMAYFGLPSILISATKLDAILQAPFEACGASCHIGFYEELNDRVFIDKLIELSSDLELLTTMSLNGRRLIDGFGANRIASVIEQIYLQTN